MTGAPEAAAGTARAAEPTARVRPAPGTRPAALSAETRRLYAGDWTVFARFCAERREPALPATPALVAAFLTQPGTGRAALARRLAAIDHQHRQHGARPPGDDAAVRDALKRARRLAERRKRAPAPASDQLRQMAKLCPSDLAGRRDRALLLLAAAGLGRTALVSLYAEFLKVSEHGVRLRVVDRRGAMESLEIPRAPEPALCPARALEDWLRVSATRYGPVFRKVNRWGQVEPAALGTDAVRLILARRAAGSRR